jgi:hypothetical protein
MDANIFYMEQGGDEWRTARLGIPTASEFATACAQKGPRGGEPKGRRTYMLKLLGERLTGQPAESYSNDHMERGKIMEAEARDLYTMLTGNELTQVGFIRRGDAGCSPDSLIGEDGLLEVKTKLPHLQLDCLLRGEIPGDHFAQLYGQLWISGRQWVDFISYWPGLPPFIKRLDRKDCEEEITATAIAVQAFLAELDALTERFAPKAKAA